jgi:hypothetical protein
VHDALRITQLEAGVPRRIGAALRQHGTDSDDVLWAALFTLAVLVRDESVVLTRAASALVAAGVFKVCRRRGGALPPAACWQTGYGGSREACKTGTHGSLLKLRA